MIGGDRASSPLIGCQVVEGAARRRPVRHQGQGRPRQRQRAQLRQRGRRVRGADRGHGLRMRHLRAGVHLEGRQPREEGEGEARQSGGQGALQHQLQPLQRGGHPEADQHGADRVSARPGNYKPAHCTTLHCPHLVSEAEHLCCRHPGPAGGGGGGGGRRGGGRGGAALAAAEPRVPALRVPRPHHGPVRPDVRAPAPAPAPASPAASCQVDTIFNSIY